MPTMMVNGLSTNVQLVPADGATDVAPPKRAIDEEQDQRSPSETPSDAPSHERRPQEGRRPGGEDRLVRDRHCWHARCH